MEINKDNVLSFIDSKFPGLKIEPGVLYIVSTPIGNLSDISFRALFVLKNTDMIAAEDTRVTGILLSHYGIRNRLISYYAQVEDKKIKMIINELKNEKSVALVSDAGTPCISDPGNILVSRCIKENIKIIPVPGASSLIHALVLSGIGRDEFYFQGFLPQKKGREKTFTELANIRNTIIIFESKYRIRKTLIECKKYFGNKYVSVSRELSKMFEQIIRGHLKEICDNPDSIKEKGEFVIVIDNR